MAASAARISRKTDGRASRTRRVRPCAYGAPARPPQEEGNAHAPCRSATTRARWYSHITSGESRKRRFQPAPTEIGSFESSASASSFALSAAATAAVTAGAAGDSVSGLPFVFAASVAMRGPLAWGDDESASGFGDTSVATPASAETSVAARSFSAIAKNGFGGRVWR